MKKIKYRYALDETGKRVSIDEVTRESRAIHSYFCISCGEPLIARFSQERADHFSHKPNSVCEGESYLHLLAKQIIRERFLSEEEFEVAMPAESHCSERTTCPFHCEECKAPSTSRHNLRNHYDRCEEEVTVYCRIDRTGKKRAFLTGTDADEKYVADLLLWNETKPDREPIAIEICYAHPCEETKVKSGLKIIEMKVEDHEDIEAIKAGVIGENKVTFYNFNATAPDSKLDLVNIYSRFCFFRSGAASLSSIEDYQYCSKRHERSNKYSHTELNLGIPNSCGIEKDSYYRAGLVFLMNQGYQFDNCILCKHYIGYDKSYSGEPFCVAWKDSGIRNPSQKNAKECSCYQLDARKISDANETLKTLPFEIV